MESVAITTPRRLMEDVSRRGLDLEEPVLDSLVKKLGLDPGAICEARLELAEGFLREAGEHIERSKPLQPPCRASH